MHCNALQKELTLQCIAVQIATMPTNSSKSSDKPKATRGVDSIQFPKAVSKRLTDLAPNVGIDSKAQLGRLVIEWGCEQLESGRMVIMNGKLVPTPGHHAAAA